MEENFNNDELEEFVFNNIETIKEYYKFTNKRMADLPNEDKEK